jgi:Flp pilus assembly protein TadG
VTAAWWASRVRRVSRTPERGSAALFVAIIAVALLAAVGLVVDGGYALADRQAASDAAEQAARAGADQVSANSLRAGGPARLNTTRAIAAADSILAELGRTGTVAVEGDEVTVTVTIVRRTTILSAVGVTTLTVTGHATARGVPGLSTPVNPTGTAG